MKFSYAWIAELVEGLQVEPAGLEKLITTRTAECEGIVETGALLADACLARVETVEPVAGTRLVKAEVETGRYGRKTVVCGAPNCRAGMTTVYAPIGVKTVQGVASDGMLASGDELGLNKDHGGILELSGEPGAALKGCAPDRVIEIDNKSLTHRPDLWGHYGMAREVAAITGGRLKDPVHPELLPQGEAGVAVAIEDPELCPRYSAVVFENVKVEPSPPWLQFRLTAAGLNPINNIVDLTNFVMAELAQPMHAFDLDRLQGRVIHVRNAQQGEQIAALNGETYALTPANLVIADAGGPIALAGVIGGDASAISESTTRIVFESANFQASSVRKTSSALRIRTDASMRFEKAQDPANTVRGLARAIELMRLVCPGAKLVGGLADAGHALPVPPPVTLRLDWLARKLGRAVPAEQVRSILESLQFGVKDAAPGVFAVTVPSWRATKDVSIPDDLVEEVGRMIGYESIEPKPPSVDAVVPPDSGERLYLRSLQALLCARGFTEVFNYSFLSDEQIERFGFVPQEHLRLINPIVAGQNRMRLSLVPGIVANLAANSKHAENFRLFEIGREIHKREGSLPDERRHVVAALYARHGDGVAGVNEIKSTLVAIAPGAQLRPAPPRVYEHPARVAEALWNGRVIGRVFELHPTFLEGRAALLDLDLAAVEAAQPTAMRYQPVQRYPASQFDLSVLCGARELAATLESRMRQFAGELVESIEYVRQYQGAPLPAGQKSVSYRLTLSAPDRTLSSDEVTAARTRLIEGMRGLGYDLRV